MPRFQLEVAVSLAACAVLSALLLAVLKPGDGKVHLPQVIQDGALQDPFDVTKAEDIVDGEPVDETKFWARVSAVLVEGGETNYINFHFPRCA